jgi:hypothetical protein
LKPLSGAPNRPSSFDDKHCQVEPALGSEQGVSVRHEDLRFDEVSVVTHIVPEVFATSNVHNVPGNYN